MKFVILNIGLLISICIGAQTNLNSLFSNHGVLQQSIEIPVWGETNLDTIQYDNSTDKREITVEFNGQKKKATIKNGKWMAKLDPMPAGGPYTMTVTDGENTITAQDMYVGEVWVCSGQSNMERQLGPRPYQPIITDWEKERDAANYPLIREYYVPLNSADEPVEDIGSKWVVCSPETVQEFSAVGYLFASDLHKALNNVPVGMIFSAYGGTPAEAWTSREALEAHPDFRKYIDKYEQSIIDYAKNLAKYTKEGSQGKPPKNPVTQSHAYGQYNAMISPLQPYAIQGVLWYQGEANRNRAEEYKTLFPYMIKDWRTTWNQGDFPFLYVQIAPFKDCNPEIREAQLFALKNTNNTAMVVTTDCGDAEDIHPANKIPVGHRLSLTAQALAYDKPIEYSGPIYEFMEVKGDKVIIYFSHAQNGMVSKDGKLKGFVIAGEDGNFVPAEAKIEKNTVIVSSADVKKPVSVRYGWANVPDVNLYNKEGLPASPFRTDWK